MIYTQHGEPVIIIAAYANLDAGHTVRVQSLDDPSWIRMLPEGTLKADSRGEITREIDRTCVSH